MKKIALFASCAALSFTLAAAPIAGDDVLTKPNRYYSTLEEAVDSTAILLPPPMPIKAGDPVNERDRLAYEEGKKLRQTSRGALAALDADGSLIHLSFEKAFGVKISKEETPKLFAFLKRLRKETGSLATRGAKEKYHRIRPFVYYGEGTCYKKAEEHLAKEGSYPSGHSSNAWATALILAEINPANKEAILERGLDMGRSRVICGYHWASDIENARITGAASVAILHANPWFIRDLNAVKEEFARLKKAGKVKFHNAK